MELLVVAELLFASIKGCELLQEVCTIVKYSILHA